MSDGQFDDAPEVIDPRAGFSYIDSSEESDDLLEEEEEGEEIEETYEDDRVEDEDWENAERGLFIFKSYLFQTWSLQRFH